MYSAFTPPLSPELNFILTATTTSIKICRTHPRKLHTVKPDGTPVCTTDLLIQSRIHRMLIDRFPEDSLLAEEDLTGEELFLLGEPEPIVDYNGAREWILDPIDGTKGYLGDGLYTTGLCLPDVCAGIGIPEEGVVLLCEKGWFDVIKVYEGVRNYGNGGWLLSGGEVIIPEWGTPRIVCCGSLIKYATIARGYADVFVQVLKGEERIWDHAAGLFCVVASGGCVSDEYGRWIGIENGELIFPGKVVIASRRGIKHNHVCEIVKRALHC